MPLLHAQFHERDRFPSDRVGDGARQQGAQRGHLGLLKPADEMDLIRVRLQEIARRQEMFAYSITLNLLTTYSTTYKSLFIKITYHLVRLNYLS